MNVFTVLIIAILNGTTPSVGTSVLDSKEQCVQAAREFAMGYMKAHPGEWFQVGCIALNFPESQESNSQ